MPTHRGVEYGAPHRLLTSAHPPSSLAADRDDYIFAVTENSGHVAMVLIEKSGHVYINEQAREKLQALWPVGYTSNMKKLIPACAQQLHQGELPINGVKTAGKS